MFKIGCHLSISNGFLAAAKEIVSIGGNTYQYFSRNPQGGASKPWNQTDFLNFKEYAKENGIEILLCHAPYTLNAASKTPETREFASMVFKDDLAKLESLPQLFDKLLIISTVDLSLTSRSSYLIVFVHIVMLPQLGVSAIVIGA